MIISLNRRFVFVHIHKCAGTSVEMALGKLLRHNDFVIGSTKSGEKNQEFFKKATGLNKHSTALEARRWMGEDMSRSASSSPSSAIPSIACSRSTPTPTSWPKAPR
jgi:hypothetical protein